MHRCSFFFFTADGHETAEKSDESRHDRKAQAEAATHSGTPGIRLIESVEDFLELIFRHTDTGVRDLDTEVYAVALLLAYDTDIYTAALRIFQSVSDQRAEDLLQFGNIRIHDRRDRRIDIDDQLHFLRLDRTQFRHKIVKHRA